MTVGWTGPTGSPLMQNHSGEHIVSGIIHRRTGGNNVGFHWAATPPISSGSGRGADGGGWRSIEAEANRAVWANGVTQIFHPHGGGAEGAGLPQQERALRRRAYRHLPGADTCACCGTHVSRTERLD